MRFFILFFTLLVTAIDSVAQTADNGLTASGGNVQLGGSLIKTTTIDQNGFDLHLRNGITPLFTTLANGNVGIGNAAPEARLAFPNAGVGEEATGMTWAGGNYLTSYGIHRTAGPWIAPNYQQLRLGWETGIILDAGYSHGKSYVEVVGKGLRVINSVGIGYDDPGTYALSIDRNNLDGDLSPGPFMRLKNINSSLPSGPGSYNLAGADYIAGNGAVLGQCYSNYGVGSKIPWTNGSGFYIATRTEHPIFFVTGTASTEKARIGANGNFLIGASTDNGNKLQVNGNEWISGKLEAGSAPYDVNPYSASVWDTYNTRFNGGNVSIFSRGDATTTGESFQLNFYARYYDGGQGSTTSKASFMKGSVTTVRNNESSPWWGQGTLVLGSTNTNYSPTGFTDVPAMYVSNGQVGIGVTSPQSQLHTNGTVRFAGLTNDNAKDRVVVSDANGNLSYRNAATLGGSGTAGWAFGGNTIGSGSPKIGTSDGSFLQIITNGIERIHVSVDGNVGIGTNQTGNYKLSVEGNIRARKVRVDPGPWADYVFESNYQLRPLKEVEKYIQREKHLPDVPSAEEVKKEGLDVGGNQAVLLKKIEELTLYVIEQQKQLEAQQQKIEMLEKKMNSKK